MVFSLLMEVEVVPGVNAIFDSLLLYSVVRFLRQLAHERDCRRAHGSNGQNIPDT
jgi:hypothetical protein